MKVALLANLKKNAPTWPGMSPDRWDDLDSEETIQDIMQALEAGGHHVTFLEGNLTLFETLPRVKPDICFNICESHFGDGREAQVPAVLEMMRMPYTGSQVLTLALALDKPMTKRVLTYHYLCPAPLDDDLLDELNWLAAAVFRVTGCLDVARVDFRLDANEGHKPYILEINPLPGLNRGYSDLCIEAAADGWSYETLINEILDQAAERYGLM